RGARLELRFRAPGSFPDRRLRTALPGEEHGVAAVGERVHPADGAPLLSPRERVVDSLLDRLDRHPEGAPLAQKLEIPGGQEKGRSAPPDEGRLRRREV